MSTKVLMIALLSVSVVLGPSPVARAHDSPLVGPEKIDCGQALDDSLLDSSKALPKSETVLRFQNAMNAGLGVTFIERAETTRSLKGRIIALEKNKRNEITGYRLAEDNGLEMFHPIHTVDPLTIETFLIEPKEIKGAQSILSEQLLSALRDRTYVTFRTRPIKGLKTIRFEGWITGVNYTTDGEYIFRVNEQGNELGKGDQKYRLSRIVAKSFEPSPVLNSVKPTSTSIRGELAPQFESYIEHTRSGIIQPMDLPPELMSILSTYADDLIASSSELPDQLIEIVDPGHELRTYFQVADHRYRLTIRRSESGEWSISETAGDRKTVDESSRSQLLDSRYMLNELEQLSNEELTNSLPAYRLRNSLRAIRTNLVKMAVSKRLTRPFEKWATAIPLDFDRPEIYELFLYHQNLTYQLDRGLVPRGNYSLEDSEIKLLSAIRFLSDKELTYWSSRVRGSRIEPGIYPRRGPGSVQPNSLTEVNYDLAEELFAALEKAGVQYSDGKWTKK